MNIICKIKSYFLKPSYQLNQVFTPTSYAELSYKNRPDLENRLKGALLQPGKQIIIYGHSGSGKSTLLNNVLKANNVKSITSQCIINTTVDEIMLDAFDKLNPYYIESTSHGNKESFENNIKADYQVISAAMKTTTESSRTIEHKRLLPPQLTPQRLAGFIGAAGFIWVIEDFHKVNETEKVKLAQIMKLFVDMSNEYNYVKIIAIGAAETGHEVVACDSELNNRVAEIEVPLLKDIEIMQILNSGTNLLNVLFEKELKEKIVKYSNNLATIAHQLAYNICISNNIAKTLKRTSTLGYDVLHESVETFVAEKKNTFEILYKKTTEQRSGKYRNVELIYTTMVELPGDELLYHDILIKILENEPEYPQGNLSVYLKKMCSPECDEVLRNDGGKYSFSDPFFKAYIRMINGLSKELIPEV